MRNDGLFPTAGRPDPDPPAPPAGPLVAIAVGKTKDGESFPAKPVNCGQYATSLGRLRGDSYQAWRSPCRWMPQISYDSSVRGGWGLVSILVHDNGGSLVRHGCRVLRMTSGGEADAEECAAPSDGERARQWAKVSSRRARGCLTLRSSHTQWSGVAVTVEQRESPAKVQLATKTGCAIIGGSPDVIPPNNSGSSLTSFTSPILAGVPFLTSWSLGFCLPCPALGEGVCDYCPSLRLSSFVGLFSRRRLVAEQGVCSYKLDICVLQTPKRISSSYSTQLAAKIRHAVDDWL